jgi:hypothetical protein
MRSGAPEMPEISEAERTPLVTSLLEVIRYQRQLIEALRDELDQLKRTNRRRKKKRRTSSGMEKGKDKRKEGKRAGSEKRKKKGELAIHKTKIVKAKGVPEGSEFKGYKDWVEQDIRIEARNTLYRMERWLTPAGGYVEAELPEGVKGHFGAELRTYIQYQYHQCHVTQPLLREALKEHGVDISTGQINNILVEGHEGLHAEKEAILQAGLSVSGYVHVDDTGAKHQGQSGHCTVIGNDLFAWFASRPSKSRVNFLQLLHAGRGLELNGESLRYMQGLKLPKQPLQRLGQDVGASFVNSAAWEAHLSARGIENVRHVKIATEGVLFGSLIAHGFDVDLAILSDDAGQFDVPGMVHGLCWVHNERNLYLLEPLNDEQKEALQQVRDRVWGLYKDLKAYRQGPQPDRAIELGKAFDAIVNTQTCFASLNAALRRMAKNKDDLLLVLKRPEVPLNTNAGETDIREAVKRKKVSGGTRSDSGREARDTFLTLKKTARKLGVSFWEFLLDRNKGTNKVPLLSEVIVARARSRVSEAATVTTPIVAMLGLLIALLFNPMVIGYHAAISPSIRTPAVAPSAVTPDAAPTSSRISHNTLCWGETAYAAPAWSSRSPPLCRQNSPLAS